MVENSLAEGSKSYYEGSNVYELFSQAEDKPGYVLDLLAPLLKGKDVLDVGCGTGKYISALAPMVNKYYALDVSESQLKLAKRKGKYFNNICYLLGSAEIIDLISECVDTVISTWALSTILSEERRQKVLSEAERVLRPHGNIILVENDIGGEFEEIRDRYPNIARTKKYNDWAEQQGFVPIAKYDSYFEFSSFNQAKHVIDSIWGKKAAEKVKDKRIGHKIVIYHKIKS